MLSPRLPYQPRAAALQLGLDGLDGGERGLGQRRQRHAVEQRAPRLGRERGQQRAAQRVGIRRARLARLGGVADGLRRAQHLQVHHLARVAELAEHHGLARGVAQFFERGLHAVEHRVVRGDDLRHRKQPAGRVEALATAGLVHVALRFQRADQAQAAGHRHVEQARHLGQRQRLFLSSEELDDLDHAKRGFHSHKKIFMYVKNLRLGVSPSSVPAPPFSGKRAWRLSSVPARRVHHAVHRQPLLPSRGSSRRSG
jgi:hypothetical protein